MHNYKGIYFDFTYKYVAVFVNSSWAYTVQFYKCCLILKMYKKVSHNLCSHCTCKNNPSVPVDHPGN